MYLAVLFTNNYFTRITNNQNDHSKRTVATVKSILAKAGLTNCIIENMGDNRHFTVTATVAAESTKLRFKLKELGFIQISKNGLTTEIACF